jgi:signal transduction histidine kinase
MRSEEADWPIGSHWLDVAWGVFAVFNLAVMVAIPTWETIPFHFIWVSLTLLYGFRVWNLKQTSLVLGLVIVTTGASILADAMSGTEPAGELAEVPLMSAMFLAMVWHARRRAAALEEVQRVSQTNARLLEREKQFLQDASHELRTPITVALGHTELIMRASPDPTIAEDASVVADELWRMRGLADRLLLLAASERPAFLTLEPVLPESIVDAALRRWSAIPREWRRSVGAAVPTVNADADQLSAALDALIENAVQHTEEGGVIELGLRADDGQVVMSVGDTGTGIAAEHLEHIFGRFARAEPGRDRRDGVGGVGLGLSIAKAIAEAHGGDLRVRSVEGVGSQFELILPGTQGTTPVPMAGASASG